MGFLKELELKVVEDVIVALDHLDAVYQVTSFVGVEVHRPEVRLDEDFVLLLKLVLGHLLHLDEGLVHKVGDIINLQKHLCVGRSVDKLDELDEHALNVTDLLEVPIQAILNGYKALVFSLVLVFEIHCNLIFLVLELPNQIVEAQVKIL